MLYEDKFTATAVIGRPFDIANGTYIDVLFTLIPLVKLVTSAEVKANPNEFRSVI